MIATNCDNQGEADRCYGDGVTICKEIDEAIKLEEVDKKAFAKKQLDSKRQTFIEFVKERQTAMENEIQQH